MVREQGGTWYRILQAVHTQADAEGRIDWSGNFLTRPSVSRTTDRTQPAAPRGGRWGWNDGRRAWSFHVEYIDERPDERAMWRRFYRLWQLHEAELRREPKGIS
ncbi:hypothetical protein [Streptomyces sp. NPDC090798]|uniref:hypothetical protein n=1 Tax=Streptomyces sp. NPDC090798 TaxID=3365968 RepID=UPI003820735E